MASIRDRLRPGYGAAALAVAFIAWTACVAGEVTQPLDRALLVDLGPATSPLGQVLAAISIVTWPGVPLVALWGLAWWAFRRRLRNLAGALACAAPLAWFVEWLVKRLVARPRPPSAFDQVLTNGGFAYPSGHATVIITAAIMIYATAVTTRQRRTAVLWARIAGTAMVLVVALDRWLMAAHWFSDIVGGLLCGALVSSLCLIGFGVHRVPLAPGEPDGARRRAAVIVNPVKVGDIATFRRHVEFELRQRGWERTIWLETTADDPGRDAAATARRKRVDLVLVAGGDGTVRVVCSGLANSGIPVALVPAGTTNLLARNLAIPFDEDQALRAAFEGDRREIDLVRLTPDDDEDRAEHFAVMAGVGVDAATFATVDENLKRAIGHAAYFVAAAQHLQGPQATFDASMIIDDGEPERVEAAIIAVGNVGFIQGGIEVIPGAQPDDELLNVIAFTPASLASWARMITEIMSRRSEWTDAQERKASRVRLELDRPQHYEMDGDVSSNECQTLLAEVVPGALTIMVPSGAAT